MPRKAKKIVEFRTYDLPEDFPVLLLDGEMWRISDVMSDRLHFHNCLEIGICHTDSGVLVLEDQTLPFRAGDVSCISQHILHTTCSAPGCKSKWSYLFLDLDKLLRDALPSGAHGGCSPVIRTETFRLVGREQHPRIHFLATALIEELRDKPRNYRTVAKSLLLVLYHELLRLEKQSPQPEGDGRPKKSFPLKPALDYIHTNYMQPCTIDELAEMCHLSTTHFRRIFLSVMGTSPLSFLNAMRINQACSLLLGSNDSVLSIAGAVGFSSISSFNRTFHQIMGVSPKAFRNPSVRATITPEKKYILQYKGWMLPDAQPEFAKKPTIE